MKRLMLAGMIAVGTTMILAAARPAEAGRHGHRGYTGQRYNRAYRQPVYHAPSVHLDTQYHVESYDWTPWQGLHTHGHYDVNPHYTPSHFDSGHGGHIDANPWFHH